MNVLGSLGYKVILNGAEVRWELVEVVLDESLQELPFYTLDVITDEPLAPTLLGRELRFELSRCNGVDPVGEPAVRAGIVVGVDLMHRIDRRHFRSRVRVSSKAWTLTLNRRRRIFRDMKASEVITSVLHAAGLRADVAAVRRTREVITQYDESDFDFVRRLCEDEGLTLIFAHDSASAVAVKDLAQGSSQPSIGPFSYVDPHDLVNASEACVRAFTRELRLAPTSVQGAEWDPKKVRLDTATGRQPTGMTPAFRVATAAVELYAAAGGHLPQLSDVTTGANAFYGAVSQSADLRRGASGIIEFRPGVTFSLEDAGEGDVSGDFLLARVQHRLTLTDGESEGSMQTLVYENDFECVPAERPFRPARVVPRPQVLAPQVAMVSKFPSAEGGNTWGEVQVEFPWQERGSASTTWVRVAQTLAGNGFGAQFLPRVGMEVIVQFIDGDPDRPLITGVVYNGKNAVPAPLPSQHSRSTIRTRSYGGGGPDNEVFFEDQDGAEVLGLIATRDHTVDVTHDARVYVKNDRTESVDNNDAHNVKGNLTTVVDKDRAATVKGNDKSTVDGNHDLTVKGNAKTTVYQKLTISADVGIVLQCGDTKIELTPTAATVSIASGAKMEITPAGAKLEHPQMGSVAIAGSGVTVKNATGAQVQLQGPMVNLN